MSQQIGRGKKRGRKESETSDRVESTVITSSAMKGESVSAKTSMYSTEMTMYLCLKRLKNPMPPEMRKLIFSFLYKCIDNDSVRVAVELFYMNSAQGLALYGNISFWETIRLTDLSYLFKGYYGFNEDINRWNVSNVTTMEGTFMNVGMFNQPLNHWDVSKVTNMKNMFHNAMDFNQPIGNWDVSKVSNMNCMFCVAAKFNQSLEKWDVRQVTNMSQMFFHAAAFKQPLEKWQVAKGINMKDMFKGAKRMVNMRIDR